MLRCSRPLGTNNQYICCRNNNNISRYKLRCNHHRYDRICRPKCNLRCNHKCKLLRCSLNFSKISTMISFKQPHR